MLGLWAVATLSRMRWTVGFNQAPSGMPLPPFGLETLQRSHAQSRSALQVHDQDPQSSQLGAQVGQDLQPRGDKAL